MGSIGLSEASFPILHPFRMRTLHRGRTKTGHKESTPYPTFFKYLSSCHTPSPKPASLNPWSTNGRFRYFGLPFRDVARANKKKNSNIERHLTCSLNKYFFTPKNVKCYCHICFFLSIDCDAVEARCSKNQIKKKNFRRPINLSTGDTFILAIMNSHLTAAQSDGFSGSTKMRCVEYVKQAQTKKTRRDNFSDDVGLRQVADCIRGDKCCAVQTQFRALGSA